MGAKYYKVGGELVDTGDALGPDLYKKAHAENLSVAQYVNRLFADADPKVGTAFDQMCASVGLALPGKNPYGMRAATVQEVLDGTATVLGSGNVKDQGSPFGNAPRSLFPAALITLIEAANKKDYSTDTVVFNDLVAVEQSIPTENFIQPVIDYNTANGPMQARAARVSEFSDVPNMLRFGTSERNRSLPTYGIGMEFSEKALRATTLDIVALTLARYLEVEKDARVYGYLSSIFAGDSDLNTGAVSAVTTSTLNGSATAGVVTHKSWVKFLARNRKFRKITHVIGDIDSYLKVESRTGRPGSNNYDPTLARIDPQAQTYGAQTGFGNDVKWFIVDDATAGGPVPANTIWALDATKGIVRVSNTSASYQAAEQFVLRRSEAMVMHWSEDVYRMFGNSDLTMFDVLTID
jgi:hypothetical protein